jgi:hypothetical protein
MPWSSPSVALCRDPASGDVAAVQAVEGQQANVSNFRSDVNLDGKINRGDVKIVKSFRGTRLP